MPTDTVPEPGLPIRLQRIASVLRISAPLLAAAWFFGGSPFAWAACGDYVAIGSPLLVDSHRSEEGGRPTANVGPGGHSRRGLPGHGPECRQRQSSLPALPVPPTVTSRTDLAALGKRVSVQADDPCDWQHPETEATAATFLSRRIERPPKPA